MNQNIVGHMIDGQLTPNNVMDEKVLKAFEAVNRADFMAETYEKVAYIDGGHPVAEGRYTLPPLTLATMIQLAEIKPTDTVMMIGCATGYSASVCAQLAKHVYAVEENQELATLARGIVNAKSVEGVDIVSTPLIAGHAEHAPYDVVMIEGGAENVPAELFDQMADGGRMVFIKHAGQRAAGVRGAGYVMRCLRKGERFEVEEHGETAAAILPGFAEKKQFEL